MKNRYIYLIRHGLTRSNETGSYCGRGNDEPLSAAGESGLLRLLDESRYPMVESVYTSPMLRAIQTVNILYPGMDSSCVDELAEADFGPFDGKSIYELKNDPEYQKWVTPNSKYTPKGVEDPQAFFERSVLSIISIIDDMMAGDIYSAAVVTHASVIGNIMAGLCLPKRPPYDWGCGAGCGFKLATSASMWQRDRVLEVMGDIPEPYDSPEADPEHEDGEDDIYG